MSKKYLLGLAIIAAGLVFAENAALLEENFETSSGSTPPSGWSMVTTAGSPAYNTGTGSDGSGGDATGENAGQVSSTDFIKTPVERVDFPGGYLVNSTVFDMSSALTVTFDFQIVNEAGWDDVVFIIGDISPVSTYTTGESLIAKFAEKDSAGKVSITPGTGDQDDRLDSKTSTLVDDTWYRGSFDWTPTSGTTGDIEVKVNDFTTDIHTLSATGFTFDSADAQIGFGSVNDTILFDNVTVSGVTTHDGYEQWATTWNTDIGAATNDFDSDGMNNLYEYAFDGNPTNGLVPANLPVFSKSGSGFLYVHPRRSNDTNLIYTVLTTTDLTSGSWTNGGYTVTGTRVTGGTLDFVTNEVDTVDDEKFIRLRIEK